eukprot:4921359-Pyramimonas_sp.AAC.1
MARTAPQRDSTLSAAIGGSRIPLSEAMDAFIADGEGGMTSPFFAGEVRRREVQLDIRAPRHHARFIERRAAVLQPYFAPQKSSQKAK